MRYLKGIIEATLIIGGFLGAIAWFIGAVAGVWYYVNPDWHFEGLQIVQDERQFWYCIPAIALVVTIIIIAGMFIAEGSSKQK